MLAESSLANTFQLKIIRSNIRDSNSAKGKWDLSGVFRVLSVGTRLVISLVIARPSVVYLTLSQNSAGLARDLLYIVICAVFRVPVVAHLHGSRLPDFLRERTAPVRALLIAGLRLATRIVACWDTIAADLRPIVGERVFSVPNATPPEAFHDGGRRSAGSKPVVAFMGHLSRAKGFRDLVAAAGEILAARPDVEFRFAGEWLSEERNIGPREEEDSSREAFDALSARYPGRLRLAGVVSGDDKARFLADASVFVLPSHAEAFPVSVLEAMAARVPVVATPVGALRDVISDGENGLIVPVGRADLIARAVIRLLDDPELSARLSEASRLTALRYSVERQAAALTGVIQSALAWPGPVETTRIHQDLA